MSKTIAITIDTRELPPWAAEAKVRQFQDYLDKLSKDNKLPFDNAIVIRDNKETRLFWLEGNLEDVKDKKTFEEMQSFLRPMLSALIDLNYDKDDPKYKEALDALQELRELREYRNKKHEHSKPRFPRIKPKIIISKK
jgi:hypothetical protein